MTTVKEESLKTYVLSTLSKYVELPSGNYKIITNLLNSINATKYSKEQFYEKFGLQGTSFPVLFRLLMDSRFYDIFVQFGNEFTDEKVERSLI